MMRPNWNQYFMEMAEVASERSTCLRRSVGCVIVKDKQVLATGYNGAPAWCSHCHTCMRAKLNIPSGERHELCRGAHAEANAICQAAKHGTSIDGASMYVTTQPCSMCTKSIINSGIKAVIYKNSYNDDLAAEFMRERGMDMIKFEEE